MKFLCIGCNRLLDVERYRIDLGALVVTCTSCGAENRATQTAAGEVPRPSAPKPTAPVAELASVTALRTPTVEAIARAASTASDEAFRVPFGCCPKCISKKQANTEACATCGLVYAQSPTGSFNPSDWLRVEWLRLLQVWGEDRRHEQLRSAAMERGELAEVGRLYRLRRVLHPEDPYAQRGLDEVLRLAVLPSLSMRQSKGEPETPRWKYYALSAVIVGCLLVIFFLVRQMLTLS